MRPLLQFFGETSWRNRIGARFTYGVMLHDPAVHLASGLHASNNTAWGRHVYAIGDDDPEAAELAGASATIKKTLHLGLYAVGPHLRPLPAWALDRADRIGLTDLGPVTKPILNRITAVVIGGISLFGGRGSIMGALFGALIVGVFTSPACASLGADVPNGPRSLPSAWLIIIGRSGRPMDQKGVSLMDTGCSCRRRRAASSNAMAMSPPSIIRADFESAARGNPGSDRR